jgi:hydroxyacylglutathione hydrolase
MTIVALPAFTDNYIWLIVNELQHTFTCVDPGTAAPVLNYAKNNGLTLTTILITHHHVDHAGGALELANTFPKVNVVGPRDARIPAVNALVRDEDIVHIDSLAFRVLSCPGHTSTHVCYQEPIQGWLFCGDTLFSAGCGRVFDGTIEELHRSISLLGQLPKNTKVYCGHEYTLQNLRFAAAVEPENADIKSYIAYLEENTTHCSLPSTIALEKKINPFMRTDALGVQAYAREHGVNPQDTLAVFALLRESKNNFG